MAVGQAERVRAVTRARSSDRSIHLHPDVRDENVRVCLAKVVARRVRLHKDACASRGGGGGVGAVSGVRTHLNHTSATATTYLISERRPVRPYGTVVYEVHVLHVRAQSCVPALSIVPCTGRCWHTSLKQEQQEEPHLFRECLRIYFRSPHDGHASAWRSSR